jgi:hypothetical protein
LGIGLGAKPKKRVGALVACRDKISDRRDEPLRVVPVDAITAIYETAKTHKSGSDDSFGVCDWTYGIILAAHD